ECAGFVAFYCNNPSKEDAFITLVLVSPFFRGRGISNILLSCVLDICKSRNFKTCTLEVKNNNLSAIRVYSNLGFLKVEENEEKTIMKIKLN
ncbi:GNAT family N-acetyltransferase, partial [Streptomyces sp. P17]|uniref:GNAT family N-acetyltransferase n=1 Tax=Streptomyces sp. P17 TaxID=3074716 RepID=UPI0028F422AD